MVKPSNQVHRVIHVQQQILGKNLSEIALWRKITTRCKMENVAWKVIQDKLKKALQNIHKTVLGSEQCKEQNYLVADFFSLFL